MTRLELICQCILMALIGFFLPLWLNGWHP